MIPQEKRNSVLQQPLQVNGAPLVLITGEQLAEAMQYNCVNGAFRAWCQKLGIRSVPGRVNLYDPKHVRNRLDAAHETEIGADQYQSESNSLTEQRRIRRGQVQ